MTLNTESSMVSTEKEIEVWRPVKGYEDRYAVSNLGRFKFLAKDIVTSKGVVQHRKEHIKDFSNVNISKNGYYSVGLFTSSDEYIQTGLHRLIAEAFVTNDDPEHKIQVNHKDGNRKNNRADNLEWVTPSENIQHAHRNSMINNSTRDFSAMGRSNKAVYRPIRCLNDDKTFDSIKSASQHYGIPLSKLYLSMKNTKCVGDLKFEFLPKDEISHRGKSLEKSHHKLVNTHRPKPVYCKETSTWYRSRAEASRKLGISSSSIVDSLRDGRSHRGYTFIENLEGEM